MPAADPTEARPSRFGSPRSWLVLLLIPLSLAAIGVAGRARQIYQAGRRYGELSRQYEGWSRALRGYEPADPVKRAYVRQLSVYYRQIGRDYESAHWQPWIEVGPDVEPPERPEKLPGRPDPDTGTPPEVAEAIDNLTGSMAGTDPATRPLDRPR